MAAEPKRSSTRPWILPGTQGSIRCSSAADRRSTCRSHSLVLSIVRMGSAKWSARQPRYPKRSNGQIVFGRNCQRGGHPNVMHGCRAELLSNNWFHAVLEASKSVAAKSRTRTGFADRWEY
jgi:hypothetical protein